jgi:hypothetical protein
MKEKNIQKNITTNKFIKNKTKSIKKNILKNRIFLSKKPRVRPRTRRPVGHCRMVPLLLLAAVGGDCCWDWDCVSCHHHPLVVDGEAVAGWGTAGGGRKTTRIFLNKIK